MAECVVKYYLKISKIQCSIKWGVEKAPASKELRIIKT